MGLKAKNINSGSLKAEESPAYSLPDFMKGLETSGDVEIPLDALIDAPLEWNFYRPLSGDKLMELTNSISENGLFHSPVVWDIGNGEYMILSGHNRVRAYAALRRFSNGNNYETIPCKVKRGISESEAREIIIDSNWVQRILTPSEKIKSVCEKYAVLGRKKRSAPTEAGYERTYDVIAKEYGVSGKQIQRYVRLKNLIPELLELLDEGALTLSGGVALAGLDKERQECAAYCIGRFGDNGRTSKLKSDMSLKEIEAALKPSGNDTVRVSFVVPSRLEAEFRATVGEWMENKGLN